MIKCRYTPIRKSRKTLRSILSIIRRLAHPHTFRVIDGRLGTMPCVDSSLIKFALADIKTTIPPLIAKVLVPYIK